MRLTSAERKNLPEECFGIPETRSYPMPDAAHVRKAIQFFGDCPKAKRAELAKNINRAAKEFKLKVDLDKTSPFKPYADTDIVKEGAEAIFANPVPHDVAGAISKSSRYFPNGVPVTESVNMADADIQAGTKKQIRHAINLALHNSAKNFLDKKYMGEAGAEDRTTFQDFVYDSDLDIAYDVTRDFLYGKSVDDPDVVRRVALMHDKTILSDAIMSGTRWVKNPKFVQFCKNVAGGIDKIQSAPTDIETLTAKAMVSGTPIMLPTNDGGIDVALFRDCCGMQDEDYNAIDSYKFDCVVLAKRANKIIAKAFPNTIVNKNTIKLIINSLYEDKVIDGFMKVEDNYIVKMGQSLYIDCHHAMGKDVDGNNTHLSMFVKVGDTCSPDVYRMKLMNILDSKKLPKIPIRKITHKSKHCSLDFSACTEGVNISEDGDITISISRHNTYMDRYAACHRLLAIDARNRNYDGMKPNIAYLVAMVMDIEAKYVGKKNVPHDAKYDDAIKARQFACGDIKRYLGMVQKNEPRFVFSKYFTDNHYDKKVYNIPRRAIIGIRTLISTILGA